MGRGRAKAKQTKVARELKYRGGNTDLSQLAQELGAASPTPPHRADEPGDRGDEARYTDDDLVAKYSDYADDGDRR